MKMLKKCATLLTLAAAALSAPLAAQAAGDIVDIRLVDQAGKKFGERNKTDPDVCSADNAFVAGERIYFRVRMLVPNAALVAHDASIAAQTWKVVSTSAASSALAAGPKLGILIGERAAYADYSDVGPETWQVSGELKTDDTGNADTSYRYFTDFYFVYTVKSGDMGLPIRLMNTDFAAASATYDGKPYCFFGVNAGTTEYRIVSTDDATSATTDAALYRSADSLAYDWPKGPWSGSAYDGPITDYDLSKEGCYVKTVDFDTVNADGGTWSAGMVWRNVQQGSSEPYATKPTVKIAGGAAAEEAVTVYVWSDDETVAKPAGSPMQTIDGKSVLTVTIPAGSSEASFALEGGATAAVGATANIYMSPTKSAVYDAVGTLVKNSVSRQVEVVSPPLPTVRVYIDGTETTKSVVAGPNYEKEPVQLTFKIGAACAEDVTVDVKATVNGGRSLSGLRSDNFLRITEAEGFDIAADVTQVTFPAGSTAPITRYVYVLGADEETEDYGIRFELAEPTGATWPTGVSTTGAATLKINRAGDEGIAITKSNPTNATEISVGKGETKVFKIQFADTYKNIKDTETGYTFYLDDVDSGDTIATQTGVKLKSGWFVFSATIPDTCQVGTYNCVLWAAAPDGLTTTDQLSFTLNVTAAKSVTILPADGTTYAIGEGDSIPFTLALNSPHKGDTSRYIFLKGATAEDEALFQSGLKTKGARVGDDNKTVNVPQSVTFLDGDSEVAINAFLGNSQTDPTDTTAGFLEGTITITVTNKPPVLNSLMAFDMPIEASDANRGKTFGTIARGVPKTFKITSVSDVDADLNATGDEAFQTKFVIEGESHVITGNPTLDGQEIKHTFKNVSTGSGTIVQVYLKDKDMSAFSTNPNFTFYVNVTDNPSLSITTSAEGGTLLENESNANNVTLTLSESATADIKAKVTIQKAGGGYIYLREDSECAKTAETDDLVTYEVTFPAGVRTKTLVVKEMDGTNETMNGLDINAEITSEELNGDGVAWKDFYRKATQVLVYVQNVPPTVIRPSEAETSVTNMNASADTPYTIYYGARDVAADLAAGIAVDVQVDGKSAFADTLTSTDVKSTAIEFSGEGTHWVTVTYADKENELSTRTIYFYVRPAKRLLLRAHGPASGVGSDSGHSSRYSLASGLGEGRVYAGTLGPQKVVNFVHTYSFNEVESTATAYAYGYKADGTVDDGSLAPGNDQAVDPNGNWSKAAAIADYYNYTAQSSIGKLGYDSFVYAWACNNVATSGDSSSSSSGGSSSSSTQKTLIFNASSKGEASLPLGTSSAKDGSTTTSYPVQSWEAVFSREKYKTDNCGDINLDGIPDVALLKYGLGVIDVSKGEVISSSSGSSSTSSGSSSTNSEGDLTDASAYNEDEDAADTFNGQMGDYLPTADLSTYASLIPTLSGTWDAPFTAKLEIRGYGEGLNDAFAAELSDGTVNPLAITGVEPDRNYANPATDKTSTLSKVEYLAWLKYAAANGLDAADETNWTKWSPERPSNPTKIDTDGDGISDGHEYYYWYLAHVGYLDSNGNHRYLTGRRFDPRNPGEGTPISADEIAESMDPIVSAGDAKSVRLRDSDNDGLPDLIEIEILGTNPFDFDTDGDGLPDGWEILVSKTDPLKYSTTDDSVCDAERNFDGDHMAYTTIFAGKDANGSDCIEQTTRKNDGTLASNPVKPFTTFAVVKKDGDSNGIQWYAVRDAALITNETTAVTADIVSFQAYLTVDGVTGWTPVAVLGSTLPTIDDGSDTYLGATYDATQAFRTGKGEGATVVRGLPLTLAAGTRVKDVTPLTSYQESRITTKIAPENAIAAWVYGSASVGSKYSYGELTLGRHEAVEKDSIVVAEPSTARKVSLVHSYVYQEYGFDPRTAWSSTSPLGARWGSSLAGKPTRTRPYTAYDEFLVMSYYLNGGAVTLSEVSPSKATSWASLFAKYTTNPRGPNEQQATITGVSESTTTDGTTTTVGGSDSYAAVSYDVAATEEDETGADSDGDGVPDGWELYVMSGKKAKTDNGLLFKIAGPSAVMSPTNAESDDAESDGDKLSERREFAGTDSCAAYAACSTAVATRPEADAKWLNKFFPSDPWNDDTDGDGLTDSAEGEAFVYGTPFDGQKDGKFLTSIPGGGLNPCSVDTDGDGLPDGWEKQFTGTKLVDPADYAALASETNSDSSTSFTDSWYLTDTNGVAQTSCNTVAGYSDGMDGTVSDAYSHVIAKSVERDGSKISTTYTYYGGFAAAMVDRDYDHDGLENWQEYLVGAMRCWRYDDPISPWIPPAESSYYAEDADGNVVFKPDYAAFGCASMEEFLYKTAYDPSSELYNPMFVTDTSSGAQYFTRIANPWDPVYTASGSYYIFKDRVGDNDYATLWGDVVKNKTGVEFTFKPSKYISCDPTKADTDQDGMDDYYELFHGLNPLLGGSGVVVSSGRPCDVVYDAYTTGVVPVAQANYWTLNPWKTPRGTEFDFEVFPWLNGLATADPDGDDILNQREALLPSLSVTGAHTDPSPLWMTDSTYTNSLVSRFYRLPTRYSAVTFKTALALSGTTFEYDGKTYDLRDIPGINVKEDLLLGTIPTLGTFSPDHWLLAFAGASNWMFSFEQNEGYDTDHDGYGDFDEQNGKFTRGGSDPQDAASPTRRQAMYFQGPKKPSLLMPMPEAEELYPQGSIAYANEYEFCMFTVECWVCPETLDDATILERAVWVNETNPGDQEFLRRNFQLAVKDGKWYGCADSEGTVAKNTAEVSSRDAAKTNVWTHLALTYDKTKLVLYVNGEQAAKLDTSIDVESGSDALYFSDAQAFLGSNKFAYKALLVGASAKTSQDGMTSARHLNVLNARGLDSYKNFFQGYVDEIRVWDGARSASEIAGAYQTRYTADLVKENRSDVYDSWAQGHYRYATNGLSAVSIPAELRYRYAFDSVPAGENESAVAKVPVGFGVYGDKPPLSRPEGYAVTWWNLVVNGADGDDKTPGYGSVYDDLAWVTWIPNTVAHLPRFDGTTLDSFYWSEDFQGAVNGSYAFAHNAEPVSLWTQMARNRVAGPSMYVTTSTRHRLVNGLVSDSNFYQLYRFTGRNRNTMGDDLLPLGGAFVKYVSSAVGFWDGQGASTTAANTGVDSDNDGLPDWWTKYAEQNYRRADMKAGEYIDSWNTIVDYNGLLITAGDAYLRDLARGAYVDANGVTHISSAEYVQTADSYHTGMPDWWTELYGIKGEGAFDDHDSDGLCNLVEYMLSERFDIRGADGKRKNFDPTVARSVLDVETDYFFPVGSLYVGEIFADHDFIEDVWERQYDASYVSTLVYDAKKDNDDDGWSAFAESRYSQQVSPIVANNKAHYDITSGLVHDFPVPAVQLTVKYNGSRTAAMESTSYGVWIGRDLSATKSIDAQYYIQGSAAVDASQSGSAVDASTSDTLSQSNDYKRVIGKWSNRRVMGTLTPGFVKANSIQIQCAYDPSSVVYSWKVWTGWSGAYEYQTYSYHRGTRAEYLQAVRKYGDQYVTLLSTTDSYKTLTGFDVRTDLDTNTARLYYNNKDFGTVDLKTGEYDFNLGVLAGLYGINEGDTNGTTMASLEDQTYRIAYAVNGSTGTPRELYLGEADTGYVREGKNQIFVWADVYTDSNGGTTGAYDVGEPCGFLRDVDIGWRTRAVELEVFDHSPIMPRLKISSGDSSSNSAIMDRGKSVSDYATMLKDKVLDLGLTDEARSYMLKQLEWIETNRWTEASVDTSSTDAEASTEMTRVRIVRWAVDGQPVYRVGAEAEVVFDQKMLLSNRAFLTEADVLATGTFDLDWEKLKDEVVDNRGVQLAGCPVTNVAYLVVIGDGKTYWWSDTDTNSCPKILDRVIERRYSLAQAATAPVEDNAIFYTARPTLKWSVVGEDDSNYEGYTCFQLQILPPSGKGNTPVWTSGTQLLPPRDANGNYVWEVPAYVGNDLEAGVNYRWRVSVMNAKFPTPTWTAAKAPTGCFRMEPKTVAGDYGTIRACVRYFGPKAAILDQGTVRVEAFTSPDFTGTPAARVALPESEKATTATVDAEHVCQVELQGLPSGRKYYVRAYVDSDLYGTQNVCDDWESWGYSCDRSGATADMFAPLAWQVDASSAGSVCTVYIEDADTNNNRIPDAYEMYENGGTLDSGASQLTETLHCGLAMKTSLVGTNLVQTTTGADDYTGLVAHSVGTLQTKAMVALALGVPATSVSVGANGQIQVLNQVESVEVTSISMTDGKISLTVAPKTTAAGEVSETAKAVYGDVETKPVSVTVEVLRATELGSNDWKSVVTTTATVSGSDELNLSVPEADDTATSAFYKVRITQK